MKLGEALHQAWQKFAQFAYAMDYDPQTDLERRVVELERMQRESSKPRPGSEDGFDVPAGQ